MSPALCFLQVALQAIDVLGVVTDDAKYGDEIKPIAKKALPILKCNLADDVPVGKVRAAVDKLEAVIKAQLVSRSRTKPSPHCTLPFHARPFHRPSRVRIKGLGAYTRRRRPRCHVT